MHGGQGESNGGNPIDFSRLKKARILEQKISGKPLSWLARVSWQEALMLASFYTSNLPRVQSRATVTKLSVTFLFLFVSIYITVSSHM